MIDQLIKNSGVEGSECEKVLGSEARVNKVASHWKSADLYQIIAANGLLDYVSIQTFNSEQLEAFKLGLAVVPEFMAKCHGEREDRKSLQGKDSSS